MGENPFKFLLTPVTPNQSLSEDNIITADNFIHICIIREQTLQV